MDYWDIASLPKEKLVELLDIFAKNWLAIDGLWFQSIEEKYDMEEAIFHDKNAWNRFSPIEAKRIKKFLDIPDNAGIAGLNQALRFRIYSSLNQWEITTDENSLTYRVVSCRVQAARHRKGMDYFPCKQVGIIEYSTFAAEIDPRFEVECLSCHPDVTDEGCNCCWKFTLK